jgi:glucokinase
MSDLAIGIDIGGHYIKAALVEGDKILRRWEEPTSEGRTLTGVIEQLQRIVEKLEPPGYMLSVGIGIPGFLDLQREHLVLSPNFPNWKGIPIKSMFEKNLQRRIAIENDANCYALGEQMTGLAKGLSNFIVLTLGTGIGGGIVLNGRLLMGAHGYAGEPGHMALGDDERCGCGCLGHLEAIGGTDAIERKAGRNDLPEDMKILWARRKEPEVARIINPSLEAIAKAIASMVHLFDPETIILGGGLSQAEGLLAVLEPLVHKHIVPLYKGAFSLKISSLGNDAAIFGAASLVSEESPASS